QQQHRPDPRHRCIEQTASQAGNICCSRARIHRSRTVLVTYFFLIGCVGFWAMETVPSALWATAWHLSVHVLVLRLYVIGKLLFSPTTFASKFTSRSPVMLGEVAPIP